MLREIPAATNQHDVAASVGADIGKPVGLMRAARDAGLSRRQAVTALRVNNMPDPRSDEAGAHPRRPLRRVQRRFPRPTPHAPADSEPVAFFTTIRVRSWRRLRRGALCGFVDLTVLPLGLAIDACPIFRTATGAFAGLPTRPVIGGDGVQKIDANGRRSYESLASWTSRAAADRFSAQVVAAVLRLDPAALDGDNAGAPPKPRQQTLDLGGGMG